MSQVTKQEQHEAELAVFANRLDAGTQSLYKWLLQRRDDANAQWPGLSGDELVRLQGEARLLAKQIKLIEQGPIIRGEVK